MSIGVEDPQVVLDPAGFVVGGPDDFSWADLPAAGWIGDELAAMPPDEVSTGELLDIARTWEKLAAWAAGNQARVLAEFGSRREAELEAEIEAEGLHGAARDLAFELDTTGDEMSLALSVAPGTATSRMAFARELVERLPATVAAMVAGEVSWSKARTILDQTEDLTPEQTATLEKKILVWGVRKTPGQVRDKLRREVLRMDPDAAARRRRKAMKKRHVSLNPQRDGMADLRIHLPGADAVLVYNWLDEHARAIKASGDERSLDQLRADALVDLVLGRSTSVAKRPLIRVLVSAETLAGADAPGEMAGYGVIDADLARQLAADGTWQRIITDPVTGAVTDVDPTRYSPPAALKAYVQARDRTCRFPTCRQPAHRCDIDHTIPFHNGEKPGTKQNPGTARNNLGVLCRRHHRLKDQAGSRWKVEQISEGRFRWTTPGGHTYSPDPPPLLEPPAEPIADPDEPPPF